MQQLLAKAKRQGTLWPFEPVTHPAEQPQENKTWNELRQQGRINELELFCRHYKEQRDDLQARVSGLEGQLAAAQQTKLDLLESLKRVLPYAFGNSMAQEAVERANAAIAAADESAVASAKAERRQS